MFRIISYDKKYEMTQFCLPQHMVYQLYSTVVNVMLAMCEAHMIPITQICHPFTLIIVV